MPVDASLSDPDDDTRESSCEPNPVTAESSEPGLPPRRQDELDALSSSSRRSLGDAWLHWSLLLLSLFVLIASFTLSVQGGRPDDRSQISHPYADGPPVFVPPTDVQKPDDNRLVIVPLVNVPLPGTCAFRRITGLPCPGCGLTRSFVSLAHGHWKDSWNFNAVGWLYFAVVLFQVPYRVLQIVRIRAGQPSFDLSRLGDLTFWILAIALLLHWIIDLAVRALT